MENRPGLQAVYAHATYYRINHAQDIFEVLLACNNLLHDHVHLCICIHTKFKKEIVRGNSMLNNITMITKMNAVKQ